MPDAAAQLSPPRCLDAFRPRCLLVLVALSIATPSLAYPPLRLWTLQSKPAPLFPHIHLNLPARTIDIDAAIAINAHAPDASVVFLEVVACRPDTKEHESLVVTHALASHLHAALLLLDLQPGHPGRFEWVDTKLTSIPPEGPPLTVTFIWTDDAGLHHEHPATDLIINRADNRTLTNFLAPTPEPPFLFAGSRFVFHNNQEFYDADATGLLVGLHTFGSETIALRHPLNPEASIAQPEWIARRDLLPPRGTPVTLRIQVPPTLDPLPPADP